MLWQALFDLEATNTELKSDLKDLYINSAREIEISSARKAVIVHVPFRLRKAFQKIHARLVRELEKKFSGKVSKYEIGDVSYLADTYQREYVRY